MSQILLKYYRMTEPEVEITTLITTGVTTSVTLEGLKQGTTVVVPIPNCQGVYETVSGATPKYAVGTTIPADTTGTFYIDVNNIQWTVTPGTTTKSRTFLTKNKIVRNDIEVTVNGDSNLAAGNIKAGSTIFGVEGTFTSDATATAENILSGKTAYKNGSKLTGTMANNTIGNKTISKTTDTIIIPKGYTEGGTVKLDSTEAGKIVAGNIKTGVSILGVAGTFTSDANAEAGHILSGKTAYVKGSKVTGTIASKAAATYTPGTSDQTIAAGQYLSGAQTIKGDADLKTENIKAGVTIFGVEGKNTVVDTKILEGSTSFPITADVVLAGYKGFVNGAGVEGTIYQKAAATYTPTTTNQTIDAGQYLKGAQTIKGDANLVSANIKAGVSIFGVTGKTSVVDTADANATAANILSGKTAYVNGTKITGTVSTKGSITASGTGAYTIPAGYYDGKTTISLANTEAGNIAKGKTILGVAGTFTSDATAIAGELLVGKTAYVNGAKITGTIKVYAGEVA